MRHLPSPMQRHHSPNGGYDRRSAELLKKLSDNDNRVDLMPVPWVAITFSLFAGMLLGPALWGLTNGYYEVGGVMLFLVVCLVYSGVSLSRLPHIGGVL